MADDDKQVPKVTLPDVQVAAGQPAVPIPPPLTPSQPPQPQLTGRQKEIEPSYAKASEGKPFDEVAEIPTQVEVEKKPELAGFMESVKNEDTLVAPVVDDYTQDILLKQINSGTGVVTLPLTEAEIKEDAHKSVWESVRWLAEWCMRQVKLLPGKVMYKK